MCGIYGFVAHHARLDVDALDKRIDILRHRGPDARGVWISPSGNVGLANRRLSIIDLSPNGNQPLTSDCGRYVLVFNGEIYNFLDLRNDLEAMGNRFRGASDSEVLLNAYRAWGPECLSKLEGMFAFAIYDAGTECSSAKVFFARDRVGEKPFYYRSDDKGFEFASELKALAGRGEIDVRALNHYLALGYVPDELCISRGIAKMPPGHAGLFDLDTRKLRIWRYWQLPEPEYRDSVAPEELEARVESLLLESVRQRLVSDVPLGVLLSGGMDSSMVVAVAARCSSRAIKTFTISLPGSPLDEGAHARKVASFFGTEHSVLELDRPTLGVMNQIRPFVDEPLGDSSIIPTFLLSGLTRQHVTVALGGDGGDELFGGYPAYRRALVDTRLSGWIPTQVHRLLARGAGTLPAGLPGRGRGVALRGGPSKQLIWGTPYFDAVLRSRILAKDALAALGQDLLAPEARKARLYSRSLGDVENMTRAGFLGLLPDDYLVKIDRMSMAYGLELRSPFLSTKLVEFAFSKIPPEWKVTPRETRRIQRAVARRLLPPDLDLDRKQGFSIPLDAWLQGGDMATLEDAMRDLPEIIDRTEVRALISGERRGRKNGARLFALMMLGIATANLKGEPH